MSQRPKILRNQSCNESDLVTAAFVKPIDIGIGGGKLVDQTSVTQSSLEF
jgi:hypothetical protein